MNRKKTGTKLIAVFAALLTAFAMTPQLAVPALADDGDPAITLYANALAKNAGQDGAQQVLFAGRDWDVIAYDGKDGDGNMITYQNPVGGTENLYDSGTVTLFQSDVKETSIFNTTGDDWNREGFQSYGADASGEPSTLRKSIEAIYLNGDGQNPAILNEKEAAAIKPRTLPGYGYIWNSYTDPTAYDKNRINGNDLDQALVWPLSHAELDAVNGGIRTGQGNEYWLRVPGVVSDVDIAVKWGCVVKTDGNLDRCYYTSYESGIRPAFNLDMQSVLLTSASVGGKVSGKTGPNALKKVTDNTDSEWILTIKDKSHADFKKVSSEQVDCQTVKVKYKGAATGTNEYISALVLDKNDSVKQYGRIKKCASDEDASGEVTISVKDRIEEGDSLYVFNEQYNGDEKTDFASEIWEVDAPKGGHVLTDHEAKEASCTETGNSEYWDCSVCKHFFGDADGTQQIEKDSWVIPVKAHTPIYVGTKATPDAAGSIWQRCSKCGKDLTEPETICSPKTVALADKTIIYDGKEKTPAVLVMDSEGKLIKSENYEVAYSNNVKAGTAAVTVTFKGDFYEGTLEQPFTIMKAANTLNVKGKKVGIRASAVAEKDKTLKVTKAIKFVNKGQGTKTYRKKSGNPKIRINKKNGLITIKKGLKAGTYKVKVEVKAKGTDNYKPSKWKLVTFNVIVK